MPKSVGSGIHGYGYGSVVGHVDEDAGGHGIFFGSHHCQDQPDEENHRAPDPSENISCAPWSRAKPNAVRKRQPANRDGGQAPDRESRERKVLPSKVQA